MKILLCLLLACQLGLSEDIKKPHKKLPAPQNPRIIVRITEDVAGKNELGKTKPHKKLPAPKKPHIISITVDELCCLLLGKDELGKDKLSTPKL
jgi:hypothetical protein